MEGNIFVSPSGRVSQASVYDLMDCEMATYPSFEVSLTEIQNNIAGFNDIGSLHALGFYLADITYFTSHADDRSIHGKNGDNNVYIYKTKMMLLIGVYKEGIEPG
ncbi:hypothetical protein INT45_012212 [Circinella minor]|uniref:Uncharacterized protein n=1 Tax=Circinella minor TaxID=1195481 RepID=A0A8H7S1Z8_9FUNG|nr:hypothetical protein INT45_012212 [Circinella minor]